MLELFSLFLINNYMLIFCVSIIILQIYLYKMFKKTNSYYFLKQILISTIFSIIGILLLFLLRFIYFILITNSSSDSLGGLGNLMIIFAFFFYAYRYWIFLLFLFLEIIELSICLGEKNKLLVDEREKNTFKVDLKIFIIIFLIYIVCMTLEFVFSPK